MAASNPPVKNVAFVIRIALQDMTSPGSYKAAPTIAAGDFKVDIDGAGFNNLGTLPSVDPAAGIAVKISLSASEMNGDVIFVQCIDQTSPKEWADFAFAIQTVAQVNFRKNVALAKFQFLMTDSTNHAPATGKTVTCTRSIDGGAFGAGALANITEVSNGTYTIDFGAADLNGNVIVLRATATGCDDTFATIITTP